MNVDRLSPALVVVLGVLAISAAAASMDSAATTEIGAGDAENAGSGNGDGVGYSDEQVADVNPQDRHFDVFNVVRWFLVFVFLGGALAYLAYLGYEFWQNGLGGVRNIVVHAITTIVPVAIAMIALMGPRVMGWSNANPEESPTSESPTLVEGGGSSSVDSAADATAEALPIVLIALGTIVVLAAVVVVLNTVLSSDDEDSSESTDASIDSDVEVSSAMNTTARRSLDDVDATNAVYRAWRDLVDDIDDADRRTDTPSEVAQRAVESGFDQQAVRTLTEAFEEVRYGQCPPTSDREARAQSALDSLQSDGDGA